MDGPVTFNAPRVCRKTGCARISLSPTSGLCKQCVDLAYKSTSDGVSSNRAKMTPEDVAEARKMRAAFRTYREIATHFGVSLPTLRRHLGGSA